MQGRRQMFEQKNQSLVKRRRGDQMVIIEHEQHRLGH